MSEKSLFCRVVAAIVLATFLAGTAEATLDQVHSHAGAEASVASAASTAHETGDDPGPDSCEHCLHGSIYFLSGVHSVPVKGDAPVQSIGSVAVADACWMQVPLQRPPISHC